MTIIISDLIIGNGPAGPGTVSFTTPTNTVICKLGATSATLSGGVGGWQEVALPGRRAGIEWTSTPNLTLSIPILMDGLVGRISVEPMIAALSSMGAAAPGSPRSTRPPAVKVAGMVPHQDRQWVINDVAWGDAIWDGRVRIRQFATVALMAYEPLSVVKVAAKKAAGSASTTYTVKRGDTLSSIARDKMGAKTSSAIVAAVSKLKSLNNIRDPKSIRPGQKLKVPKS